MHVYIRRRHTVPYRRRFSLIKPNYKLYLLNESTYGYDLAYSTQLSSVIAIKSSFCISEGTLHDFPCKNPFLSLKLCSACNL